MLKQNQIINYIVISINKKQMIQKNNKQNLLFENFCWIFQNILQNQKSAAIEKKIMASKQMSGNEQKIKINFSYNPFYRWVPPVFCFKILKTMLNSSMQINGCVI